MPGGRNSLGPRGFLTDEEKNNMPKVTKELILRILGYLKPYLLQFILVFVAIILSATVGLLPSIITGKIVDEALVGKDLAMLIKLLVLAFVTMAASQVIGVLESYINSWISNRIIFDMKNQMYNHLQNMPHSFFTSEKQGDIITRMNTDISGVSSVISGTLTSIVSNIATVVTTLVALLTMNWQLALVGIVVIPLLVLPTKSVGKQRYKLLTESQAKHDEMNQKIDETLSVSGSLLVKIFTREKKEYEDFVNLNEEVTRLSLKESRSGRWFRIVMGMFTQIGPLLIYFAGGFLIIRMGTDLTVGTITATVALINRLYRPVESLLNVSVDFTRSLALFNRIFDYFDRENTIKSPENGKKPPVANEPIAYDHVAFTYGDPEDPILTDVDFTVPGGKMYAIVGPSGSGKSTVVNLIPRLYDVLRGSVSIGGTDVRDFDLTYLRENIGVVTQDTYLFNGTILENLQYARDGVTMEEIEAACKVASIYDFIMNQPDGFQTKVGNRGLKLSGGEKQRLSIARVMLKNPNILILDEATSALDSISESAIQDALDAMMVGRTSIVIAHRLSTILKADKILVVKGGVIAEQGTHDELLAQGGIYRELYETQFRQAIDYEEAHRHAAIQVETLTDDFLSRRITEADIEDVYHLCKGNERYYRYMHEQPSKENLTAVITDLPEGSGSEDKYFVGFYDGDELVGLIDLITGYPDKETAYIGWLMVAAERQHQGIGTELFGDIRAALSDQGFRHIRLGCITDNQEGLAFWKHQGFTETGEIVEKTGYSVAVMQRDI